MYSLHVAPNQARNFGNLGDLCFHYISHPEKKSPFLFANSSLSNANFFGSANAPMVAQVPN